MPTNYVSKISDGTNTYDIKDANAVHTVDQTYDDTSANPQSGVALKSVIDGLQDYIEAEEAARISEDNSLATDISDLGTNLINERNMRIAQDNALYGEILDVIPSQTGNSGKFLTTNGSEVSWGTVPTMTGATSSAAGTAGSAPAPSAGDEGKYLKGNGSWSDLTWTYNSSTETLTIK